MRTHAPLMRLTQRPIGAALLVVVAACCWLLSAPQPALAVAPSQDIVMPTVTPAITVSETVTVSETGTASETGAEAAPAAAEPIGLPAPFYFIDGSTNQILRLEADGSPAARSAVNYSRLRPLTWRRMARASSMWRATSWSRSMQMDSTASSK